MKMRLQLSSMSRIVKFGQIRMINITRSTLGSEGISVEWSDGHSSNFHALWLRDNCMCPKCTTVQMQKLFETITIETSTKGLKTRVLDNDIECQWQDGHISRFPSEWLRRYSSNLNQKTYYRQLWDGQMDTSKIPTMDYKDYDFDTKKTHQFLADLWKYGVGVVSNVPSKSGAVLQAAEVIGPVQTTSWGKMFDIESKPDPNHIGYTNHGLAPHTDGSYRTHSIPGLLLTHYVRVADEGGHALMVDGFAVAEYMKRYEPEAFHTLTTVPRTFRYRNEKEGLDFYTKQYTISVDPNTSAVCSIKYNNNTAGPLELPYEKVADFYKAWNKFASLLNSEQFKLEVPLPSGSLLMVINHRILHGRTAFRGRRHVQGCYLPYDAFLSKLRVTSEEQINLDLFD